MIHFCPLLRSKFPVNARQEPRGPPSRNRFTGPSKGLDREEAATLRVIDIDPLNNVEFQVMSSEEGLWKGHVRPVRGWSKVVYQVCKAYVRPLAW